MRFSEILTIANVAKFISFLSIMVAVQIAVQMLIKKIISLFTLSKDETTRKAKAGKRIYKILGLAIFIINITLVSYLTYQTIYANRDIPQWFGKILKSYGSIVVYGFLCFVIYRFGSKFISKILGTLMERTATTAEEKQRIAPRIQTMNQIVSYILMVLLVLFFIYESLTTLGVDLTAAIVSVGAAGVAIGFGAQNLVKDYLNGFLIFLEDRFAVGDVVTINNLGGAVEKLTLRVTSLRTTTGTLITIPNGEIGTVQNQTKDWSRVDFTMGVDYSSDIRKALKIMREELEVLKKEMPLDLLEPVGQPPDVLALESFGDSSLNLRIWFKTKPSRQWEVQRRYNLRLLERFKKDGITIPFPQRTLSVRDEAGNQIKALMK